MMRAFSFLLDGPLPGLIRSSLPRPGGNRVSIGLVRVSGWDTQPEGMTGPDLGLRGNPVSPGLCTALDLDS